ncbi:MAG: carboxypeptidase-like regulatory domain-containing protein [Bacteroidia bacterium]|nr:carboxypeptidase-like regulatory domain-containing protein [Bacteroidia bacterium]
MKTSFGTTSNSDGYFNLKVKKLPAILFFSYLGYEVNQYQLKSAETNVLKIYLKPEIRKIGEVTISGDRIINLIHGDTLNIVDYEEGKL